MNTSDPAVVLIEGSDFETFPAGGQLSMSRALMKLFGSRLALVGMSRPGWPTGRWTQKQISGTPHLFFSVVRSEPLARKPFIPARFAFYAALCRHKRGILSLKCGAAFTQAPEALLAISRWSWESLCFWFPGVENQLKASRYAFAKPLAGLFDKALFSALDRVDVILGAADEDAINALVCRSNGRLARERVINVPTCVDTSLFHPIPLSSARTALGIPANCTVFVTVGRIGRFKGWELLLDAFQLFLKSNGNALLFFVGDGEDRPNLQGQIDARGLDSKVTITGFQTSNKIAFYLNAADAAVFGSLLEGWSVAMLEALACGKPVVSTEVSGASTMISSSRNGFLVKNRNPVDFAEAMESALYLPDAKEISLSIASEYDLQQLGQRLAALWHPLRGDGYSRQQLRSEVGERISLGE